MNYFRFALSVCTVAVTYGVGAKLPNLWRPSLSETGDQG